MIDDWLHRLNWPQGRFFERLRIDLPLNAYPTCCFISAGAASLAAVALTSATSLGEYSLADYLGALGYLIPILTVIGMIVAAPFVPFVTWLGHSLRIESAFYYGALGGLSAAFVILFLFGIGTIAGSPARLELLPALAAGSCGSVWGLAWWYLHRRWKN